MEECFLKAVQFFNGASVLVEPIAKKLIIFRAGDYQFIIFNRYPVAFDSIAIVTVAEYS